MTYHPIFFCEVLYNRVMKTLNDVVVDRLCQYLEEKNITQYRLAILSGIPFATIKSIMQRRTKNITLKTVIMLANGLGVSVSEFLNSPSFDANNIDLD